MADLIGKRALITGSTSGIGLGIARALARSGCDLVLNGFGDSEDIEHKRSSLEQGHHVHVRYHRADLRIPSEIEDLVTFVTDELGGVDILVNCAGVQHTAPIQEFPRSKWDEIVAVNLSASFHTCRSVVDSMLQAGWGRIINIASVHGLVASRDKSAYVAAKHGLVGLTKVVALETAGSGVTVNAICPGWTRTELIEPQIAARADKYNGDMEQGARDLLAEKQPSLQFATPDQIGGLVVFLCSDAASQITGAALPIDGAWSAQ